MHATRRMRTPAVRLGSALVAALALSAWGSPSSYATTTASLSASATPAKFLACEVTDTGGIKRPVVQRLGLQGVAARRRRRPQHRAQVPLVDLDERLHAQHRRLPERALRHHRHRRLRHGRPPRPPPRRTRRRTSRSSTAQAGRRRVARAPALPRRPCRTSTTSPTRPTRTPSSAATSPRRWPSRTR